MIFFIKLFGKKNTFKLLTFWFKLKEYIGIFNLKNIPIIIISFNQIYNLKQLISFLETKGYLKIVIIDNNSDYTPVIEYLKELEKKYTVHWMDNNYGHKVFWDNKYIYKKYSKGYYVVTDPDVVPDKNCPEDFLMYFRKILDNNLGVYKVGFSLKIDDIPETNPNKDKILNWEKKFWFKKDNYGNYRGLIDTTFALYRPNVYSFLNLGFYTAIRAKKPYFASHRGWYVDFNNLTEEQKCFYNNTNNSSSWKTDLNGNLIDELYD